MCIVKRIFVENALKNGLVMMEKETVPVVETKVRKNSYRHVKEIANIPI